jgi:hypothetical protein
VNAAADASAYAADAHAREGVCSAASSGAVFRAVFFIVIAEEVSHAGHANRQACVLVFERRRKPAF